MMWLGAQEGDWMHALTQVLHGGDNDVLWLQRDFHLYVVNAFDTEKACQVRSLPLSESTPQT